MEALRNSSNMRNVEKLKQLVRTDRQLKGNRKILTEDLEMRKMFPRI